MMTKTAERTIAELRRVFATHGLPAEQLVLDNGAQFTSDIFQQFLKENGIKHVRSAPHHPFTNGEAERFVQTFKNAMKAEKNNTGLFETKLARFLLVNCGTPSATTGESPAKLLFYRPIRTSLRLSLITHSVSTTVSYKQADQKSYRDQRCKERQFEVNQSVLVKDHSGNS